MSATNAQNIIEKVKKDVCNWAHEGESSLFETFNKIGPSIFRRSNCPFRLPVLDVYKYLGKTCVDGRIDSGQVDVLDEILIMPGGFKRKVYRIESPDNQVEKARSGENVRIHLSKINADQLEEEIQSGFVLCSIKFPIQCHKFFKVELQLLTLLKHKPLFTAGYNAIIYIQTICEECTIKQLLEHKDKTGKTVQKNPKFVKSNSIVTAIIECNTEICVEIFSHYTNLGNFILTDEGSTIVIGKIVAFRKQQIKSK